MAAVMLFLRQTTGKTERHTHFCIPLEPVFTRDCGGRVHFTDEPTGALDSRASKNLLEIMSVMNRDMGATILMVTHDAYSASYAGRVLFLKDGRVFNELFRGERERSVFYHEILEVLAALGGDVSDVI